MTTLTHRAFLIRIRYTKTSRWSWYVAEPFRPTTPLRSGRCALNIKSAIACGCDAIDSICEDELSRAIAELAEYSAVPAGRRWR